MKFYRGDSLPSQIRSVGRKDRGRTFAEHFCGNGLMSKFADDGSWTLLRGMELLDMILSHVGYQCDQPEERFSYRSPFLSFTSDASAAFDFAERSGKKDVEECPLESASYFIWELEIELPYEVEPGRFQFSYKASSTNCYQLILDQIQRGLELEARTGDAHNLAMGIMSLGAGWHADNDHRDHRAELIDVSRYVRNQDISYKNPQLVNNTLERATRSNEWLLYPTDPIEDGPGLSSRFAMNRHLRVFRCYRDRVGRLQR